MGKVGQGGEGEKEIVKEVGKGLVEEGLGKEEIRKKGRRLGRMHGWRIYI